MQVNPQKKKRKEKHMVSIVAIASFAFLWHFVKAVYESRSKGGGD